MDLYLPTNMYSMETQDAFFEAGLVYPCYISDTKEVSYFPSISTHAYKLMCGDHGDPLFHVDPKKMVCVITPPIPTGKFNYNDVIMENKPLPQDFVEKCLDTIDFTLGAFKEITSQLAETIAFKFNLLSSGKATIAIFIKMKNFCEFGQQRYYTPINVFNKYDPCDEKGIPKIRIIPEPIVMPFAENAKGFEFNFKFLVSDDTLFDKLYIALQHFVEKDLGFRMRFIKQEGDTVKVVAQMKTTDEIDTKFLIKKQHAFLAKNKYSITPHIVKMASVTPIEI